MAITFLNHTPCGTIWVVDHINKIKTDNKLSNLRIVSHRENISRTKGKTSDYTGVCWCKTNNKWLSRITYNKITSCLGYYTEEIQAAEVYKNKLKELVL